MAWLRVDDRFTEHPKFAGWSPAERWDWLALLCYCARYRTQGAIPLDASLLPALHSAPANKQSQGSRSLLAKAVAAGLAEQTPAGFQVHDWNDYNPADSTAAERKRRQRVRDAERDADRDPDRDNGRDETVTRARARARGPVPSPERANALSAASRSEDGGEDDRRQAWMQRAAAPDVRSPAGFVRAGIASGDWPDPFVADERTERHAVNMPVTVDVCPECGCSPPLHTADCSHGGPP
jgi:hypothetical protein